MAPRSRQLRTPPFADALPAPIWFRADDLPSDTEYPRHRHAWGEFVYAYSGVMELMLADRRHLMAPPQYGVWLPPQVEHVGLNRHAASHCSLYVCEALCAALPREACALTLGPLVRAVLEHLRRQHVHATPLTPADERLLRVLVDQLALAPRAGSYLPGSEDPVLAPVLRALDACPGDERSLAELAQAFHTTERTLLRRCRRELGMSFSEWRQRLRVVKALPRLQAGQKVEAVALELGYASGSAFITMFKRLMGMTPDEFRRSGQ